MHWKGREAVTQSAVNIQVIYLMGLGRPIGVRLFWGLGRVLRIRIDDTFPRSSCFCTSCNDDTQIFTQIVMKELQNIEKKKKRKTT